MTLEKFVETHKLENGVYKDFNKFKLNRLIRKYKYIDVLSYLYDDEENPDHNNWLDIEGIDYGWLWCNHKTEFARRNRIKRYAKSCYNNELIYYLEQNDIVYIIFRKYDTLINMIRLSNNKLNPYM